MSVVAVGSVDISAKLHHVTYVAGTTRLVEAHKEEQDTCMQAGRQVMHRNTPWNKHLQTCKCSGWKGPTKPSSAENHCAARSIP